MSQLNPDQLAVVGQDPENPSTPAIPAIPPQQQAIGDLLSQMLGATQQGQQPGQSVGITMGVPQGGAPNPGMDAAKRRVAVSQDRLRGAEVDPQTLTVQAGAEKQAISNRYRKAVQGPLGEIHDITEEHLKPLQTEAERADAEYQNAVKARKEYRTKVDNVINTMDTIGKRIAAEQPRDIWAESGLGIKVAAIALTGLGGAAQALYGDRTNSVTDAIDAAIKRDLALQRMRLEKSQDDYGNKNLLLGQLRANMDRTEHAEDAAHATAWQGIIGRLSIIKGMLTDPTMRANAEKVIAEGQMKAADSTQRMLTTLVGTDQRMKQAETHLEIEAAKLNAVHDGETAKFNAQTRALAEQRLRGKDTREQAALKIPEWEPINNEVNATQKEVSELREGEASAYKASQSMETVIKKLQEGGEFTSYPKWQDIEAAVNRSIVKLKGKSMLNMGANFSDMENELTQRGFLGSDKSWKRNLDPAAAQRIQDALSDMWEDVRSSMKERNFRPTKTHPVFGKPVEATPGE